MMPIFYKFEPGGAGGPNPVLGTLVMYLLFAVLVGFAAHSGWRGATGPFNAK
jgi:hypothetical protein